MFNSSQFVQENPELFVSCINSVTAVALSNPESLTAADFDRLALLVRFNNGLIEETLEKQQKKLKKLSKALRAKE